MAQAKQTTEDTTARAASTGAFGRPASRGPQADEGRRQRRERRKRSAQSDSISALAALPSPPSFHPGELRVRVMTGQIASATLEVMERVLPGDGSIRPNPASSAKEQEHDS